MIDLEDGVSEENKEMARKLLLSEIPHWGSRGHIWIRTNATDSAHWQKDAAVISQLKHHIEAVVIPKASKRAVALAAKRLAAPIVALIETAQGVEECAAIAAHKSVQGLMFGGLDYLLDFSGVGAVGASDTSWAQARIANAATAHSKLAIAGPSPLVHDLAVLKKDVRSERAVGFAGKLCLHPDQLSVVEEMFTPNQTEQTTARAILNAIESTESAGAFKMNGAMVDRPVIERARHIISAIQRRSQ